MNEPAWRRLDVRMLAVFSLSEVGAVVVVLFIMLIGSRGDGAWQLIGAVLAPSALVTHGLLRWLTVRYRVGVERIELRSGLLNRQVRSVPRDRVRTVDLTSSPLHRLFGLSVVEIGTGSSTAKDGRLHLNAVATKEGERLRRELLDRSPIAWAKPTALSALPTSVPGTLPGSGPVRESHLVATLRLSWLRFAPLTTAGLVALSAVFGTGFKLADDVGVRLGDLDAVHRVGDRLGAAPLWLAVVALTLGVLVVVALGSMAVYLEGWWGYRLTREPDGTLRLRRGLLTTRSLSIEQRRMRGAEVAESLLLRLFGGARCAAVSTGLDAKATSHGALLPPAPLAEAHRVAAQVLLLGDPADATGAALDQHPPAALRRRLIRTLLPTVIVVASAWWLATTVPQLAPAWPAALLALPLAALLGLDRYRNLGHALRPEYLVIGQGSLIRRRVALQRRGIIGWRLRQSVVQRLAGLVTVDVVTAASAGRYSVVDLSMDAAVHLVNEVNPGLLPTRHPTNLSADLTNDQEGRFAEPTLS
ncbi:MAG: PH domain-containing protein [Pseudonocardia sp.]|nr:PH domain-containing protein [Pseudonocardia sp.]